MRSSPSNSESGRPLLWRAFLILALLVLVGGCIADTAEDSDLPWASDQGWEGLIPLPSNAINQYD